MAQVRVSGYYRKDGTYVQPHYRSNPDGNPYNNWSYPGNVDPYTGKVATGNADTYLDNYYNRNTSSELFSTTTTYPTYPSTNSYYYPSTPTNSGNYQSSTTQKNYNSSNNKSISNSKATVNNAEISIDINSLTSSRTEYYISALKANLRLGPTIYSTALEQIDFGSKVYLIENFDKYWSKVLYKLKQEVDEKQYVIGFVNTSFLNSYQTKTYQTNSYEQDSEPEKLVKEFLTDLGNRNFYSAYSKSRNPIWKTYEWFSSTSAYGGINKVVIYEIKLENIFGNEAIVYARYFANDAANNTSETYKQIFIVKYIDNSWKITRAKLVDK